MLTTPSQLSKRFSVKKIIPDCRKLNSATPWKLYYGNTFKQNTDNSKLPQFDVIKLLKEENDNATFTLLWCKKCVPH